MMSETHARLTKHFRNRLKAAGIKARCKGYVSCGTKFIQIDVPTFEARFTEDEQRVILTIAKVNGLKLSCMFMDIDENQMTYSHGGSFTVPPEKH